MQKTALYAAAAFFAVGSLSHLLRLFLGFEIVIDGASIPVWMSLPSAVIAALFAAWMVVAARRGMPGQGDL